MLVDLALFAASAVLGLHLQRRPDGARLREGLWGLNYVLLIPLAATYAFLSIDLDRQLLAVVGCGLAAWWLTVAVAGAWARLATGSRPQRGAVWLVGAFPNTGFIGFPLAHLAFGQEGLRLAVVYDQVSLVVPAIVVATVIATHHARDGEEGHEGAGAGAGWRPLAAQVLRSPPLWTVLVLLVLRATLVHDPIQLDTFGTVIGHVVGPVGFLLLGMSLPLEGFSHDRREVTATLGAVLVRLAAAPALVWLVARATGTDVPDALYLVAAMPTAFHAIVLSRIHGLDAAVLRLGVLVSSTLVIGGVAIAVALGALPGA